MYQSHPRVDDNRFADLYVKRSYATGSGRPPMARLKMGWLHLASHLPCVFRGLDCCCWRIGIPLSFEVISTGVRFVVASCVSEKSKNIISRYLVIGGISLIRQMGRTQERRVWTMAEWRFLETRPTPSLALLPFDSSKMGLTAFPALPLS